MMKKEILENITKARKAKDTIQLEALQAVKAAVELTGNKDPSEGDYISALKKVIKQYTETLDAAHTAKREDLYEETQKALSFLEVYTPKQLTEDEVKELITITALQNKLIFEKKNMGNIVKLTVTASNGCTDGKTVSKLVNEFIQGEVSA